MATLTFDGSGHKIYLLDKGGNPLGEWTAFNNIDRAFAKAHYHSLTHLCNGTYTILDRAAPGAHIADANGPYGIYGIIRFFYAGHPGVGVHSGRAGAKHMPGPQHPTHGCIRTTDAAMLAIRDTMKDDHLGTITISANSGAAATNGTIKHRKSQDFIRTRFQGV